MKTTELMIGNWVKINYKDKNVKVTDIHDGLIDTTSVSPLMEDEFKPIPLTGEILEKNGFKYNDLPFFQYFEQWGLQLYRGGNGFRINCGINVSLIIDSVHQLQQVIKLCGIEKEITI